MEKITLDSQDTKLSKLSPDDKRKLLAKMLRSRAIGPRSQKPSSAAAPILRATRGTALPVSFSQERLWFLSKLEPNNFAYNIVCSVRFIGNLRVEILDKSLSEIVKRHEILRTTIGEADGRLVQVISAPDPINSVVVDLQELCEDDRRKKANRITTEEAQRPFDLSIGPLLRVVLLKLGVEEHLLILAMHHTITDGWSFGVFTRELDALYKAFLEGKRSPLPDLPIQYVDFANWQREWLHGEVLNTQLEYWKNKLGGELSQLRTAHRPSAARGADSSRSQLSLRSACFTIGKAKEV